MRTFTKVLYMGILPVLYIIATYGILDHNKWSLDTAQTVLLLVLGSAVAFAAYIVGIFPTKREVDHE